MPQITDTEDQYEEFEGDLDVDLDEDEVEVIAEAPDYEQKYPELKNIARDMDDSDLDQIASLCLEEYRLDNDSRGEWLEKHALYLRLYNNDLKPKNQPWPGASAESIPILTEACSQFSNRSEQVYFRSSDFIRCVPSGNATMADLDRCDRISKHMNWRFFHKTKQYKRNKKRLLRAIPLHGSFFTKTYYDPVKGEIQVDNVRPNDLIVAFGDGPRDIEDVERKTHRYFMSVNKTKIYSEMGYFLRPAESYEGHESNEYDDAVEQQQGLNDPGQSDHLKRAAILEQHRFLDLDDDGIAEPYIVWVDETSEKVLRIAVRYELDSRETVQRQVMEPMPDPMTGQLSIQPVIQEQPNENFGEPVDYEPVEYFTHYPYMENPDGFYALGLGHMLGEPNKAINKMLRQAINAGTLATTRSGFISKQLAMRKGIVKWKMGVFNEVDATTDDIRKGIMPFEFNGPDQGLVQLMQHLTQRFDRLGMVTDALTGTTEKVYQPTTIMALIEQGLQPFTAAMDNIIDANARELDKIYRLMRKYMNEEEYFAVLDAEQGAMEPQEVQVARDDYAHDYQVTIVADVRMATEQQKAAKAQAELQFGLQNPFTMNSPPHLYNLYRRFADQMGIKNIEEILPDPSVLQNAPMMPQGQPQQGQGAQDANGQVGPGALGQPTGDQMGPGAPGGAV